jgi:RNA-directed DNA polymerase
VEGRESQAEELLEGKMPGTQGLENVSTKLQRIAALARTARTTVFTTLAHHIDAEFLREAYRRTRKSGAAGVDGGTAAAYEADLERNLGSLLERFKSGSYHAPPVRRVHIPKSGGKTRPIGIPTFEDKVLQRSVAMVLEAIYEQDFKDGSYGFRPNRSPHLAIEALWKGLMDMGGGWVLEADIQHFFDDVKHDHLRMFLDQRVRDGVLRRVIDKWLKAGVMEEGTVWYPDAGTPQGGVISPLLANIYLHAVLDVWFEEMIRPRLRGKAFLIRYADDFVIAFQQEDDARRVMAVLPKRFGKYGLTLHPEKTRIVEFRKPTDTGGGRDSFDLLGFTHFWAKSQKGYWVVKRKTSSSAFSRALKRIADWCRRFRHQPVAKQHVALQQKLRGHYGYFGIRSNARSLGRFFFEVTRTWRRWLDRRSNSAPMTWDRFRLLVSRYTLPTPRLGQSARRRAANPSV